MSSDSRFMFWEESWNRSENQDPLESVECCGKWDEFGKCTCKQ